MKLAYDSQNSHNFLESISGSDNTFSNTSYIVDQIHPQYTQRLLAHLLCSYPETFITSTWQSAVTML